MKASDADPTSPAAGRRKVRAIELSVRNRGDFLLQYDASFTNGGVFCPTRRKAAPGTPALVLVRVGRRQPPVLLHGLVAWQRPGRHLEKIRAGIAVEFLPGERAKSDYLIDLAKAGGDAKSRRRHERLPIELPVSWRMPGVRDGMHGTLRDIGRGGAFLLTQDPIPRGREVVLEVSPPGAQVAMAFTARVCWAGELQGAAGFGIEWRARDAGGGRRIRELVRRLSTV